MSNGWQSLIGNVGFMLRVEISGMIGGGRFAEKWYVMREQLCFLVEL